MGEFVEWGSLNESPSQSSGGGGGGSNPNVMRLQTTNRVRILDSRPARWRQHIVENPDNPDSVTFMTCSQDGCPLCRKPEGPDPKTGKSRRYFPVQRRFATNVWDYESGSVKILIAGPQVFDEFASASELGYDPAECDWIIHKTGTGKQTSYKLVRGDKEPFGQEITPTMLHDLSKYITPPSDEQIFETLERMGIDYDALPTYDFSLEEALSFVMPYGKHKGMTIEQMMASEEQYAQWLHSKKSEDGAFGDPVYLAINTVLENRNGVNPKMPEAATLPAEVEVASQPVVAETVTAVAEPEEPVAVVEEAEEAEGFTDPRLPGKVYKTKGALTQAINRLAKQEEEADQTEGGETKEAVLDRCRALLAAQSSIQSDYSALLNLFSEVAGKRDISSFTADELLALEARLKEMDS